MCGKVFKKYPLKKKKMSSIIDLKDCFSEFKEHKNIDRVTMMRVLEDVFKAMLEREFGTNHNYDIIVNADKGDLEIWRNREIVADEDLEDENLQIAYSNAVKIEPDFEIGEEVSEEIPLKSFGRRAITAARQNLINKLLELEKEEISSRYREIIGEIVTGEVYQIWKREILVLDDDGNELLLPRTEQIPGDFFRKGDTLRAVVERVESNGANPRIILSRTSPEFLERLFELEVPEIADGLISIQKVVRQPGERAKVAVETFDDRIDPVGACVGMKGSRIFGIVKELKNENIDVINYTNNIQLYITRALSPAKITSVEINEAEKSAEVTLNADQVSLAIGRKGLNIKLASQLTGYEIEVYRDDVDEEEFDIDIEEFSDEIEPWVLRELKNVGCDTAKSVLKLSVDEIVRRTELEEEQAEDVLHIFRAEFE